MREVILKTAILMLRNIVYLSNVKLVPLVFMYSFRDPTYFTYS